jgi:hypothetical protein
MMDWPTSLAFLTMWSTWVGWAGSRDYLQEKRSGASLNSPNVLPHFIPHRIFC